MQRPLFIKWQERNNTGIPIIDEQHRGILSIINSLYYLTSNDVCDEALCAFISKAIKDYARIHFITEEGILQAVGYPGLEKQKEAHAIFALETEQMEHVSSRANDTKPLLNFLKKWWLEHINEEDMQYVSFLRKPN